MHIGDFSTLISTLLAHKSRQAPYPVYRAPALFVEADS